MSKYLVDHTSDTYTQNGLYDPVKHDQLLATEIGIRKLSLMSPISLITRSIGSWLEWVSLP